MYSSVFKMDNKFDIFTMFTQIERRITHIERLFIYHWVTQLEGNRVQVLLSQEEKDYHKYMYWY